MDDRYHAMREAVRAGRDPVFAAEAAAKQLSDNIQACGVSSGIQRYTGADANYHIIK